MVTASENSMTARVRGLERTRRTGSAGSAADVDSRSVLGEQTSGVTRWDALDRSMLTG
jgi:hypothetical protein